MGLMTSSVGVIVLLVSVAPSHNVVVVVFVVLVVGVVLVFVCVGGFGTGRIGGWNGCAFADMDWRGAGDGYVLPCSTV